MLNAHPELAIPREMRYLSEAIRKRKRWTDLSDMATREDLVNWIVDRRDSKYLDKTKVPRKYAREQLMAQTTLGSVLGRSIELYAERIAKPRWGDKRPLYILFVPELLTLFPDAQFIEVVRDPRGAVSSMKELGWFERNVAGGVELWRRSIESARVAESHLAPDQFLRVRYETLLAQPEVVLSEVAAFAGLDPAGVDRMVDYSGNQAETETMRQRYHANVSKGIDPTIADSWRRRLDEDEVRFIEKMTASFMQDHDYAPVHRPRRLPNRASREMANAYRVRHAKVTLTFPRTDRWSARPDARLSARLTAGQRSVWDEA